MTANELIDFLLIKYNGGDLNYSNHEMDNSVIMCKNIADFVEYVNKNGFIYEGFIVKFGFGYDGLQRNIALVFKDENDEVFWVHSSTMYIHSWIQKTLSGNQKFDIFRKDNNGYEFYIQASEILDKFLDENNIKG